jgi:4-aminobutyrate aminotransferase-like enzyme
LDDQGNKYLDAFGGADRSVGHANPKVVEATSTKVKQISHTSTLYANKAPEVWRKNSRRRAEFEEIVLQQLARERDRRLAAAPRTYGADALVVLRHSYSGRSVWTLTMCGRATGRSRPTSCRASISPTPYCYRCPFNLSILSAASGAEDIEELILTETAAIAAFFAETVIGAAGSWPPPGYFEKAAGSEIRRAVHQRRSAGAWGRTGDHMFSINHWKVTPVS